MALIFETSVSYLVSRKVEAAGQEREIYQRTWDVCICRLMKVDEDICGELESIHASNPEIAKLAWKAGPLVICLPHLITL